MAIGSLFTEVEKGISLLIWVAKLETSHMLSMMLHNNKNNSYVDHCNLLSISITRDRG